MAVQSVPPSLAQEQPYIAVVDLQYLVRESGAGQKLQEDVIRQREEFQNEIGRLEDQLRDAEIKIIKDREDMSPDQMTASKQEFEKQRLEARQKVQARKRALEEAYSRALRELQNRVVEEVSRLAKERDYKLVLPRQGIVSGDKELDITEEALARLNKAVDRVDFEVKTGQK